MKRFLLTSISIHIIIIFTISCMSRLTRKETNVWLDSLSGVPGINISGQWKSGSALSGGWGDCQFVQTGMKVTGIIGLYNAEGVVRRNEVFLVLYSRDTAYFTAKLTIVRESVLEGIAVEGKIYGTKEAENAPKYPMVLTKAE